MKSSRGSIATTPAEMRAAASEARRREKTATKIRLVRYDAGRDEISVELSTGSTLNVPRHMIAGFASATAGMLADVAITPGHEGLWSESIDDGVLLEQLLVLAAGEMTLGSVGARINASKQSPARAAASRTNGVKGGRPRKSSA